MSSPPARPPRNARPCPALNGFIKPADCGAQRGSKLDCPPTCEWFPFGAAGYDRLVGVEEAWLERTLGRLTPAFGASRLSDMLNEASRDVGGGERNLHLATQEMVHRATTREREAGGKTMAERWAAEGWSGLDNDSRYFMTHWLEGLVTVIELDRPKSDREIVCRDLLAPDGSPFLVVDRTLVANAVRFTRVLTWIWRFPHMGRVGGAGITIDHGIWPEWLERLESNLATERRTRPGLSAREFLTEHHAEAERWAYDLTAARREQLLASLRIHHCTATWTLHSPMNEVASTLAGLAEFDEHPPEPEPGFPTPERFFRWLRRGESQAIEKRMPAVFRHDEEEGDGVGVLGSVRLYRDRLVVETLSQQKHRFARKRIEQILGPRVQFGNQRIEDVGKRVRRELEASEAFDAEVEAGMGREFSAAEAEAMALASRPAKPEIPRDVQEQAARAMYESHYRKFLEDRIPSLGGLTPRQAAADPGTRPRLVDLMKNHLHRAEQTRREGGFPPDLTGVLAELGLHELA